MKLELCYEDADIVAYSKPSGLLSIPDRYNKDIPCLYHLAAAQHEQLFVVHRLDKDTSGLICFAKTAASHKYMSGLFEGRVMEKYYLALVHGRPQHDAATIDAAIAEHPVHKGRMSVQKRGRASRTDYEVLDRWNAFSLLRLRLYSGRTHQIRVHLQHLGHPVVCDSFYGQDSPILLSTIKKKFKLSEQELEEKPLLQRLGLHASELIFNNEQGKRIELSAPLPKDMAVTIKQIAKWGSS